MATQQPNAWHTASRSRNSASRTPQNRSGTQSPSQQTAAVQSPRQDASRSQQPSNPPANNVWTQRSSNSAASNGSVKAEASPAREDEYRPVNGFNAAEVKQFMARDVAGATVYKPAEGGRNSGSAWGHKPNHMANNQPFFAHLAKQTTTVENIPRDHQLFRPAFSPSHTFGALRSSYPDLTESTTIVSRPNRYSEYQQALRQVEALSLRLPLKKLPLRPNLPLPVEVRCIVWRFLLLHQHVRRPPYGELPLSQRNPESDYFERQFSKAHTFKFHTSILGVNRQIHKECVDVLRENQFVIITQHTPFDTGKRHDWHIPIVSESPRRLWGMRYWAMSLRIRESAGMYPDSDPSLGSQFCVVADDLPLVCDMIQHGFYSCPFSSPVLVSTEDVEHTTASVARIKAFNQDNAYFDTEILITDYAGVEKHELRRSNLLQPLLNMKHPGQRVTIQGVPIDFLAAEKFAEEIDELKRLMGPQPIWLNALVWDVLTAVRNYIDQGNAYVANGKLELAAQQFCHARELGPQDLFNWCPDFAYETKAGLPLVLLWYETMEAALTEAALLMKLGGDSPENLPGVAQFLDASNEFYNETILPTGILQDLVPFVQTASHIPEPAIIARAVVCETIMKLFETDDVDEDWVDESYEVFREHRPVLRGDQHFDLDDDFHRTKRHALWALGFLMGADYEGHISASCLPVPLAGTLRGEQFDVPPDIYGFVDLGSDEPPELEKADAGGSEEEDGEDEGAA